MLEISEKEWAKVLKIFEEKSNALALMTKDIEAAEDYVRELKDEVKFVRSELKELKSTNRSLGETNSFLASRVQKEEANVSLVLEKLNECFEIMTNYGLTSRVKRITSLDLKV